MAMIEIENVSVYSGNRMRPFGKTVGLHRGCQPSRWDSLSPSLVLSASRRAFCDSDGGVFSADMRSSSNFTASSRKSSGFSSMSPSRSHFGAPVPAKSDETLKLVRHDSQVLAMMVGQKSHNRPRLSTIMQVLQSGKPRRSAIKNASLHLSEPFGRRDPYTATSSALRSPEPRYQETNKSPLGHSTMPGA